MPSPGFLASLVVGAAGLGLGLGLAVVALGIHLHLGLGPVPIAGVLALGLGLFPPLVVGPDLVLVLAFGGLNLILTPS